MQLPRFGIVGTEVKILLCMTHTYASSILFWSRVPNLASTVRAIRQRLKQTMAEVAKILSAGAPVEKALVQIMKLWRLQRDSQELQQSLEQMLPYFRFVAGQHGKPKVE